MKANLECASKDEQKTSMVIVQFYPCFHDEHNTATISSNTKSYKGAQVKQPNCSRAGLCYDEFVIQVCCIPFTTL